MSNEKLQADSNLPKRTSRIRKGIQRTLTTAKYESIVISCDIDEEIEWTTLEIRDRKIQNWETILLKDFKRSHDRIMEELGLSHKKAYLKNALDERDQRPEPGQRGDFDELNLDALETVG